MRAPYAKIFGLCLLLICIADGQAGAEVLNGQALLHDQSGVLSDPAAVQAVLDELQDKTGVRLWLVTMPELPEGNEAEQIEIAAMRMLQALDSGQIGRGMLLLLLTKPKLLAIKGGARLDLAQRQLREIQQRIIIPRLREGDCQQALLNGSLALAHLAADSMGVELALPRVAMEKGSRWWQRVPLEPKHLWLPGLLLLFYLIMKKRKRKNG